MRYKCSFCTTSGEIGTITNQPKKFLLSRWYRDVKGFNHEIIICNSCGCIHDVQFSFLNLFASVFLGNPYKLISAMNLMEFGKLITDKMQEYNANARSIAYYEYGINEIILDYLVNNRIIGNAFADKLEEQDIYSSKKSSAIAKKINDMYFNSNKPTELDELDMTMFGFKD